MTRNYSKVRQDYNVSQLLQSVTGVTKSDNQSLQSVTGFTKCDKRLLKNVAGITNCNSYYKVRCNTCQRPLTKFGMQY